MIGFDCLTPLHLESTVDPQINQGSRWTSKDLPHKIDLAIGMKVMVTDNLETDLDITNGARGDC